MSVTITLFRNFHLFFALLRVTFKFLNMAYSIIENWPFVIFISDFLFSFQSLSSHTDLLGSSFSIPVFFTLQLLSLTLPGIVPCVVWPTNYFLKVSAQILTEITTMSSCQEISIAHLKFSSHLFFSNNLSWYVIIMYFIHLLIFSHFHPDISSIIQSTISILFIAYKVNIILWTNRVKTIKIYKIYLDWQNHIAIILWRNKSAIMIY